MDTRKYQDIQDKSAALIEQLVQQLGADLITNPEIAEALVQQVEGMLQTALEKDSKMLPPPDGGLAGLVGLGSEAALDLGATRLPYSVDSYDDKVTSAPILGIARLYYVYQHERAGVFLALAKLQQHFSAGTERLSEGPGAFKLSQSRLREVLRNNALQRHQAYRRVFGYGNVPPPPGAQPNRRFHALFMQFLLQTARFFQEKRITQVVRQNATDLSFGSVAVVRRTGLDLRDNLKNAAYGDISVLSVDFMQQLDEAFRILNSEDVKRLYGADNAWDVIEEVLRRYVGRTYVNASHYSRLAEAGRAILNWLAQPHILNRNRAEFEALLTMIIDDVEESLMSQQSLARGRDNLITYGSANGSRRVASESLWQFESE